MVVRSFRTAGLKHVILFFKMFFIPHPWHPLRPYTASNMYHHFCDFFNLYAAQHVNNSDAFAFSRNNQVGFSALWQNPFSSSWLWVSYSCCCYYHYNYYFPILLLILALLFFLLLLLLLFLKLLLLFYWSIYTILKIR